MGRWIEERRPSPSTLRWLWLAPLALAAVEWARSAGRISTGGAGSDAAGWVGLAITASLVLLGVLLLRERRLQRQGEGTPPTVHDLLTRIEALAGAIKAGVEPGDAAAQSELKHAVERLCRQVGGTSEAELREMNERLARINEELIRKNKELDDFSYAVSHDLQEPLRTLIAFSDFLMRDYGDRLDEAGREYVRYLGEASRRMRALIHDLLACARAGRVTREFEPVDLEEVLEAVQTDLAELIRSRGAEVRVQVPLPRVWGDRDRIGQLFANLISNGLKYNRSPVPIVEIGTGPDDRSGQATLWVRDNGIGIDPQFHAKIFQIFRRLHPREEYEGTGAGLAICQKIIQAHGGRIWVESVPGAGSTFYLTLPQPPGIAPPPRSATVPAS
ncbi:MAG: histidine kinase [Isosphaeraceae bacterium]|nr:histidine kinase [Isosphaeraceae bacterium]